MHRSGFPSAVRAALVFCALGALVAPHADAQSIHPLNMVSGVDSVSSADGYQKTFYTVPSGQTFVLTDMTTEASSNKALLFDGSVLRYIPTRVAIGGIGQSCNYLSLATGIAFKGGHQLTLAIGDNPVVRFSWSGYLVPSVVGVAPSETEQRLGFALTPNPSGQVVELRFELRKAADVSLRIYDVQGRLVATLADARMRAGRHDLSWTGMTGDGAMAASGVYFARLESSEVNSVRRLVRVR
jgi:hypothetical protein